MLFLGQLLMLYILIMRNRVLSYLSREHADYIKEMSYYDIDRPDIAPLEIRNEHNNDIVFILLHIIIFQHRIFKLFCHYYDK